MITRNIYINSKQVCAPIHIVYGTSNQQIQFCMKDVTLASGNAATFYCLAPNNQRYSAAGTIDTSAGTITFTPAAGFFVTGNNLLQCEITQSNKKLYNFATDVICERNVQGEGTPSEAVAAASYAERAEAAAETAESVLESIPQDYSALSDEVEDIRIGADGTTYASAGAAVRGQVGALNNSIEYMSNYQSELTADEVGLVFDNLDLSDTTETTLNYSRLTTAKKIDSRCFSGVSITAPTGYRFYLVAYENENDIAATFKFDWRSETTHYFFLMFPCVRIVLAKTSGYISPNEANNFNIKFTKTLTDYSEKEMSLMLDAYISKDIIPFSFGDIGFDPTNKYSYDPWQGSATFETANVWLSDIYRCVAGDTIEIVSNMEANKPLLATFSADGTLNYYVAGQGINNPKKTSYTFTANDKYFRVATRRTEFRYAYVKYHSQFNNNRYIPDYAKAEYETVLFELQSKMLLGNPIVFGFNTDQHTSYALKEKNVLYGLRTMKMLSNEIPFDFQCLGGDAPSYSSNQVVDILNDINNVNKQMIGSDCPVISIVGNHDAIDNNSNVTNAELYNVTFKRAITAKLFDDYSSVGCNAYIDSAMHSVRYIFVDSIPRTGYTLVDVNTFLASALSTLPNGYHAIIISHRKLNLNLPSEMGADGIDCTATLETYASKIIVCINGHSHQDGSDTINGILYVSTTTAGLDGLASSDTRSNALGTANETAYDVFVIDQNNKKVYTIRYGYGENREWSYTLT